MGRDAFGSSRRHWTASYGWPRSWAYRLLVATGWENYAADRERVTEWGPPHHNPKGTCSTKRALWLTLTGRRRYGYGR